MTIEEVANYLKVNIRTVYRMLKEKEIPAFKVRNQWRFKKEEVDGFIKKHYGAPAQGIEDTYIEEPGFMAAAENERTIGVPVVGSAACGTPILAEENIENMISVSTRVAKPPFRYFFLRAKGDSMNLAGIDDGALVLVRQQNTASDRDIVVALIDDEATIKEYNVSGSAVVLKPLSTNREHSPIVMSRNFIIQGVVITTIPGNA